MNTLRRWVVLLIVVEAVMLAAAVVGGVIGLTQLGEARSRVVDQIDPELVEQRDLETSLLDQETGLRGFLLTSRPDFLAPYREGRVQQDKAVSEMRRLGAADGTQAGRDLAAVLAKTAEWQATAERMIAAPGDQSMVETGKTQFDAVRAVLNTQRANLTAARENDRQTLQRSAVLLPVVFAVIVLLLVILFVALALGFHRRVARPVFSLAAGVRAATDDIGRAIPPGDGPRELKELARDVEALRRRLVAEVASLATRTRELQQSNSDLEQFAYVASHDLQEPLRKVTSFCQLIQQRYQGQLDERGEQYIAFAVDGARRMQVLINDLLAFSRVGRRTAESTDVDMTAVVRAALGNLDHLVEETGAEVEFAELPVVRGEASLLTTVIQNLVGNAIKFRGQQPPRIAVEAARQGDEWVFSVSDNGIGIEAEYADRIFVIFQRLHPRTAYPGTGIGLAMARRIVEYHGGRIWLDTSGAGERTIFRFTLPVRENNHV
ncbi:sensor histidine kinase [Kibdelosporangium phytohabitans]|uniref:histidine kinase n=1 Tax=Kibdelosporangium phytohabitans TaxID=860235 RepID=A0A0N9I9R4_9PSEU|nr:sensor histidine kinase [Kibdelosporangium phytohabitans]ALG11387.1 histidine kinase [Kibdelosporangium phytohabitans]MBE1462712.1 signal transduction histidine kinase [Kibdelosporangium phytohabitans]